MDSDIFDPNKDPFRDFSDDSEDSSTSDSGPFDNNKNFVMEVHELRKDAKADSALANNPIKHRKKRKKQRIAASSNSLTDSSSENVERASKEQFFDARDDSFHAVLDQVQNPVATTGLAQAHSEHGEEPKLSTAPESASAPSGLGSAPASAVAPTAIKKPSTQP